MSNTNLRESPVLFECARYLKRELADYPGLNVLAQSLYDVLLIALEEERAKAVPELPKTEEIKPGPTSATEEMFLEGRDTNVNCSDSDWIAGRLGHNPYWRNCKEGNHNLTHEPDDQGFYQCVDCGRTFFLDANTRKIIERRSFEK